MSHANYDVYDVVVGGDYSALRSRLEQSYCSSVLPSGLSDYGFNVTIRVQVYDSLSAYSWTESKVSVSPVQYSPSKLESLFSDALSGESTNVDETRSAVSMAGSVLNTANCSLLSLDCGSLNRHPCSVVDMTCGLCYSGYFGDELYSNTKCLSLSDFQSHRRRMTEANSSSSSSSLLSCESDDDCGNSWLRCHAGVCESIPKSCMNNCSNHGSCVYVTSNTGSKSVYDGICRMGSLDCAAECICASGYAGSTCAWSDEEMRSRQLLREKLLSNILSVMSKEEVSDSSVLSWVSSIVSLTQRVDELSVSSRESIWNGIRYILESALSSSIPFSYASKVVSCIPSLMWQDADVAELRSSNMTSEAVSALISRSVNMTSELLRMYSELVASSIVVGENPVTSVTSLFTMSVQALSFSSIGVDGGNISLSTALSELDVAMGAQSSSITFPSSGSWNRGMDGNNGNNVFSILSSSSSMYNNSLFKSRVVGLRFPSDVCVGAGNVNNSNSSSSRNSSCDVVLTLQNSHRVDFSKYGKPLPSPASSLVRVMLMWRYFEWSASRMYHPIMSMCVVGVSCC
jgi:hypothetical protein